MCLSDLTSHETNQRLEPLGPPLLASLAVLSTLWAGLSGHIWQHVPAAILWLWGWPTQLQTVNANVTYWLAVPAEFLPRGRMMGLMEFAEPFPVASTFQLSPSPGLSPKSHALCSHSLQEDTFSSKATKPQQIWVREHLPLFNFYTWQFPSLACQRSHQICTLECLSCKHIEIWASWQRFWQPNPLPQIQSKLSFYDLLSLVHNIDYSHIILFAVLGPATMTPLIICSIQLQSWSSSMARSLRRKLPSESRTATIFCNYCSGVEGNTESLEMLRQIKNYLLFKPTY